VLRDVTLELELSTLGNKALAAFPATILEDPATSFGRHPSTESVLFHSAAAGRLEGAFHGRN